MAQGATGRWFGPSLPHVLIHVIYTVNGTTCNDWYSTDSASVTMSQDGTVLAFVEGGIHDDSKDGGKKIIPVKAAQYLHAERVIKYD